MYYLHIYYIQLLKEIERLIKKSIHSKDYSKDKRSHILFI